MYLESLPAAAAGLSSGEQCHAGRLDTLDTRSPDGGVNDVGRTSESICLPFSRERRGIRPDPPDRTTSGPASVRVAGVTRACQERWHGGTRSACRLRSRRANRHTAATCVPLALSL